MICMDLFICFDSEKNLLYFKSVSIPRNIVTTPLSRVKRLLHLLPKYRISVIAVNFSDSLINHHVLSLSLTESMP